MRQLLSFFGVILLTFFGSGSEAQPMSREDVLAMRNGKDSASLDLVPITVIINGIPYLPTDRKKLDSALALYDRKHLLSVEFLRHEKLPTNHLKSDLVVLQFVVEQQYKTKLKRFRAAARKFKDDYKFYSNHILSDAQDPVLYVNGVQIHHSEAKKTIMQMKPDQIFAIIVDFKSKNQEIFGQNAKNGLVQIWSSSK